MLSSPDYADIFTARVDDASGTSIEQRVRTALGGNARARALLIPMIQRVLLGLRLAVRPSRDHLLGWKIAQRGENWFRIEASSWFLTGHVVFHLADGELSIASFVRYDRQVAALIWPPASLIHRQVVHALMRQLVSAS